MTLAIRVWTPHARRMPCLNCELPYLLELSRPPDSELVDLIEQTFLEGQIDSEKADLAYTFLQLELGANTVQTYSNILVSGWPARILCGTLCGTNYSYFYISVYLTDS